MTKFYQSYQDVKPEEWRWKNFSPREIACKGTGTLLVNEEALDRLQALRETLGRPLLITSAYRSPQHNKAVGGAKDSYHMKGVAFDVRMENLDPALFQLAARDAGFRGFGYYTKQNFMHIDTGPAREWGKPFPISGATRLPEESVRKEKITQSTTVRAVAVDLAAKAGAGFVAYSALPERTQLVVAVLLGIGALASIWVLRERVKAWLDGIR